MKKVSLDFIFQKIILLFLFASSFSACQKEAPPPNVVVLFTDDQRFNTIHALGNEEIHTPNMDKLAKMGVSFTRAHVMGSHHGAVCAPSRAMLLSGKPYMNIPKAYIDQGLAGPDTRFPFITFPEMLRSQGYSTFFTGKWHNHTSKIVEGFSNGTNIFIGGMHWPRDGGHRKPQLWDFDSTGVYLRDHKWQGEEFSSKMYSDAAMDFIEKQTPENPFCLYVAYTSPHDPREAPKEYLQLYDTSKIQLPPNFLPQHPFDNGHLRIRDELLAPFPRTPEIVKSEVAAYYAMISEVDAQIGRIIDALEEKGLLDNTIIVFAGDNGLAVGQHGLFGKQSLYEHSVRVPMVIAAPGIEGGKRANTLCYLYDIFPTICDLMGLDIPESVEGKSLFPALKNESKTIRDHLFLAHARQMRAIRADDDWKLIQYFVKGKRREQLYNLKNDPWEQINLASEAAHDEKKKALSRLLSSNITAFNDDFIQAHIELSSRRFGEPVGVNITSSFPDTEIRYTLDSSEPHLKSLLFSKPFLLEESSKLKAALFLDGNQVGKTVSAEVKIVENIRGITLKTKPSPKYPAKGKFTLMDGANGSQDFKDGNWLGYNGDDFEAIVELQKQQDISEIGIRYFVNTKSWIFPPPQVEALVSEDGRYFKSVLNEKIPPLEGQANSEASEFRKKIDPRSATFIKFKVKNIGKCPDWHPGKGGNAWLFLDELFIN